MKLMFKINLVALGVLVAVGLAITWAGITAISRVTYRLNREVMSREVENVVAMIQVAHKLSLENRIHAMERDKRQAQADVVMELKNYQYGKTGNLIIVTGMGLVVKHDSLGIGQSVDLPYVEEMAGRKSGHMAFEYKGENRLFSYKYFPEWDWLVVLSLASREILAARAQFLGQVTLILIISLLLGALVFIWFTGKVVGPIRQLATATTYFSEGKWDAPLPKPAGKDEVAQLTSAFRQMAARLAHMYGNLNKNLEQIAQSQNALRESEEKYRGLVELLPLTVFETDVHGRLVFANRYAFDIFGYTEAGLAKGPFLHDLAIAGDRERVRMNMDLILKGKNPGMMEYTGQRKDKSRFPGIAQASAIYQDGQLIGIRGIFIDITERKALEIELRRAQEFLTAILNNVADPIFVKDEKHRWVLLNAAFCRFIGYSREDLLGKTDYDYFPKEEADEFWEKDDLVFASNEPNENEELITDANDKQHVILTKKAVFLDAKGQKLLVGIIKDITERKLMEQELLKSQKLKSIGILAGGIAHDFNNILTAIMGNLSLAKMSAKSEDKVYQRIVESEHASMRARDLTQQLLIFSRGGAPVKETVSLASLIEESVTFTLRGSKVRCDLSLPEDLWPVEVDTGQISRVIHNMVVNASQAMPEGGAVYVSADNLLIESSTTLPLSEGRYVRLVIKDEGVGISREILPNIFDPYFTTKQDGSGLGLATAYSIISRHEGHITVESEMGHGAAFSLYLPASQQTPLDFDAEQETLRCGQGTILVMDDEEFVRDVVGDMLLFLGYSVAFAADGAEALKKYKKRLSVGKPFDAVIMDLTIPGGMGGQEAIKRLLEMDPDAKAFVSSGYSQDPVMANFADHGFAGVITKPFEIEKLGKVLDEAMCEPEI